jgi:octaprenyl-diphosphate synthase
VRKAIQKGGIEDLEHPRRRRASGALDYTAELARDYVACALPASKCCRPANTAMRWLS